MQGWLYGKGLIYLTANILVNKINLPQGQSYSEGKKNAPNKSLCRLKGRLVGKPTNEKPSFGHCTVQCVSTYRTFFASAVRMSNIDGGFFSSNVVNVEFKRNAEASRSTLYF